METQKSYQSIVFAGGGSRCLWGGGFWSVLAPQLKAMPRVVAGVSAGATIGCFCLADQIEKGLNYFKKITGANERNFYPRHLLSKKGAFPHYGMYRSTILEILRGTAFKNLMQGPEMRILLSHPPAWLGARSATFLGLGTYSLEKKISYPVHPTWASKLGYRPEVVNASECTTSDELADLLLQSSCTPPMVPIMRRNGQIVLDGGLIDNVPVAALDNEPGETLVILSRRYPRERLPKVPGRTYVQPSEDPPISKWDYTSPEGLQQAYDMGRRDGEEFLRG